MPTPKCNIRRCLRKLLDGIASPPALPLNWQRSAAHGEHTAIMRSSAVHCTQRGGMTMAH